MYMHHGGAGGVVQQVELWSVGQQDFGLSVLVQHRPARRRALQTWETPHSASHYLTLSPLTSSPSHLLTLSHLTLSPLTS